MHSFSSVQEDSVNHWQETENSGNMLASKLKGRLVNKLAKARVAGLETHIHIHMDYIWLSHVIYVQCLRYIRMFWLPLALPHASTHLETPRRSGWNEMKWVHVVMSCSNVMDCNGGRMVFGLATSPFPINELSWANPTTMQVRHWTSPVISFSHASPFVGLVLAWTTSPSAIRV